MENLESSLHDRDGITRSLNRSRGITNTSRGEETMENVGDLQSESGWASAHSDLRRREFTRQVGTLSPQCTVLEAVDIVHAEHGLVDCLFGRISRFRAPSTTDTDKSL